MGTKLSDVIVPEIFNPYVIKQTMEKSALVQSGIVTNDAEFNSLASQGAPVVNMPFFADLTGESEQIIEDTDLTADKITSNKDIAAILRRAKMWSATDLAAAMANADPMQAIAQLVAGFWARDMQKELIAILNGIFGSYTPEGGSKTTPLDSNILDISAGSGAAAKWSPSTFIDAQTKLGDAQDQLTGIAVHSATYAQILKDTANVATVRPEGLTSFTTYMGKRLIVDDGCPVTSGVYTSYLFGAGAVALGNGSPVGFVPTEIDRDKKKGSGVDYLINRRTSILHPRGVAFTSKSVAKAEGPSRTELADAQNWNPVYEPKQIRIVEFKHKLG